MAIRNSKYDLTEGSSCTPPPRRARQWEARGPIAPRAISKPGWWRRSAPAAGRETIPVTSHEVDIYHVQSGLKPRRRSRNSEEWLRTNVAPRNTHALESFHLVVEPSFACHTGALSRARQLDDEVRELERDHVACDIPQQQVSRFENDAYTTLTQLVTQRQVKMKVPEWR